MCMYKNNISVGILKIITEMFLPHIAVSELEEECFSKILPKVNNMLSMCCLYCLLCDISFMHLLNNIVAVRLEKTKRFYM